MPGGDGTGPLGPKSVGWGRGPCGRGLRGSLGSGQGRAAGWPQGWRSQSAPYQRGVGWRGPWMLQAPPLAGFEPTDREAMEAEMTAIEERLSQVREQLSRLTKPGRGEDEE